MSRKVGVAAAALLVVSAGLTGCSSSFDGQRSLVLVANRTTSEVVVRLWPVTDGGSDAGYRVPAGGSGILPEKLGFFEGEVLDDACLSLALVQGMTTYQNAAYIRLTVNGKADVSVEPVAATADANLPPWPKLEPTFDCSEPDV